MSFKQHLFERYGISPEKIPGSYQQVGDIVLLKFPKTSQSAEKKAIAQVMLRYVPYAKTVCEMEGIRGELRTPKVGVLASKFSRPKTETTHRENGIAYLIDVRRIMFSKGNVAERQRLLPMIKRNEVIVDMFAGIGYFSLGLARFTPCSKVYAIEKNPMAFRYLKKNIKLNKIDKIRPIAGDCRKVSIREKADRVIMGYFPETQKFLPKAFSMLGQKGTIHYHNIYPEEKLWHEPVAEIEKAAKAAGFKLSSIVNQHIVKSFAPRVQHVVIDAAVEKAD
jgi:tRNA wybutosine-synthesizing protein 2